MVCLCIWYIHTDVSREIVVYSDTPEWHLHDYDFDQVFVRARGAIAEYVPNQLLTPEAFDSAAYLTGRPQGAAEYLTSRFRLYVPDGRVYALTTDSVDFADIIYINGQLYQEIGHPASTKEEMIPQTRAQYYTVVPENGVIEIVQQMSAFVHREGGNPVGISIGSIETAGRHYDRRLNMRSVVMGCYLSLFLVHLALFFFLPSYRANLYLSLLCLVWLCRTGVTGDKPLSSLFPALPWIVKFRMEYLALPLTGILVILILKELFPGLLPRWLRIAVYGMMGFFCLLFSVVDSLWMSWLIMGCYACVFLSMAGVLAFFVMRLRHPSLVQWIVMIGAALFFYAGVRDMLYYSQIALPPFVHASISQIFILQFVFFQMAAMFIGTLQAAEAAMAIEQRLAAENAALDRANHMKSDMLATIAHETRTPLAVLSGYADLVSMELRAKGVDAQTTSDLNKIAVETQRIARMMEEMQKYSRVRDTVFYRESLNLNELIQQVGRMFSPILARKNTALSVEVPSELLTVYANPDELTQVLYNLLINAQQHTTNGKVTLSATVEAPVVRVTVSDTGSGIPETFLPQAFEKGTYLSAGGSGLGLAISREIIEAYGGSIGIRSEEGVGTCVFFSLPIQVQEEPGDG